MHPLVGEINLDPIDVGDLFVFVDFLDFLKQSKDVGGGIEIDAVLRNEVLWKTVAQFRRFATEFCEMREDECNTHQSIAT